MRTYINPVYPHYFADPYVWRHDGTYYAVGTRPEGAASPTDAQGPSVFPLLRSQDLVHWSDAGYALVRPDPAFGDTFWAPEVVHHEGRWLMYYSVGHADRHHQLRVATATRPAGPYADCAQLTDPDEVPFAIDPHPFQDSDGRWYLFHARDFLDCDEAEPQPVRVGTALVVQALDDMTQLAAEGPRTVARARCDWQRFARDRAMYGRVLDWHTLEGPCVVVHGARYYCLYSGGCWQEASYGVDYVVAENVLGPYTDDAPHAGPRVLRSVPGHVLGPGHCSLTVAPAGGARYLAYHAWGPERRARRMHIDPLRFTPDGPRCLGPTWTSQPLER